MKHLFTLCAFLSLAGFFGSCDKDPEIVYTGTPVDELAFTDAEKSVIYSGESDSLFYVMNFFIYADSLVLRTQCRDVNLNDTTTLFRLIDRMYTTVTNPAHEGVGIAAPQIGICRNVIWVQRWDKGGLNPPFEVYLNPRITNYSDTSAYRSDGCLSIPGVSENSWRAKWVDVEYDRIDGTHNHERISQAYTAHIFQHEIDHLNGILFIDRLY